jgi:ArsR family transcriptional regulator, lead/cadmium/zinc/bismuth-responsive transcriptional repressor
MIHDSYYFFANFANKTKFNILMALKNKPLSVLEIADKIGEEQSKVSHNLLKLTQCHLLRVRQNGKRRIYSLNKKTVVPLLNIGECHIKQNCSQCKCKY